MKILFISKGNGADYLADMAFHGFRSLFGTSVVDVHRLRYMYKNDPYPQSAIYGKGFTLYKLIEEGEVDRTDIPAKIKARFFDLIVYGSIQREHSYLPEVLENYGKEEIIFLDGEDQPLYLKDIVHFGMYFKRELHTPQNKVFPIQFGIPEEKLIGGGRKGHVMAPLDPFDERTYIYDTEKAYYDSYRTCLFGKTMKKAGWDCLRHYEIMACECIPYFQNLEYCPQTIMMGLPKDELLVAKTLVEYNDGKIFGTEAGKNLWADLNYKIQVILRERLTTKALAKYILDTRSAVCQSHSQVQMEKSLTGVPACQ